MTEDSHSVECEDPAKVARKGEWQSVGIQSYPGEGPSSSVEKPGHGQSPLCERPVKGEDDGKAKIDGAVAEGSQASKNELSIGVMFNELNVD